MGANNHVRSEEPDPPKGSCCVSTDTLTPCARFLDHWSLLQVSLRGTREPPRSWTQRVDGLAASAAAVTLVWCGHTDGRLWTGGRQRSAPTAGIEVVRRWCRTAVSCNSPGDTRWTPGRASWWHSRTMIRLLVYEQQCSKITFSGFSIGKVAINCEIALK